MRSRAVGVAVLVVVALALADLPSCSGRRDVADQTDAQGCRGPRDCGRASEAKFLDAAGGVRRAGDNLSVATRSGGTVSFTDSPDGDPDGAWYSYSGRVSAIGYHLIEVRYNQGGGYLLVNPESGKQTPSAGVPVVSPSAIRLVATSADPDNGVRPNSIQIWHVADSGLVTEYERSFVDAEWGPGRAHWSGDETLHFDKIGRGGSRHGEATLTLTDRGWQSDELPSSPR